ncbi:hypothetical protein [Mesorhizobium sp.]|nr:hypothetical protein [Mesorhizobium sp.]
MAVTAKQYRAAVAATEIFRFAASLAASGYLNPLAAFAKETLLG